MKKFLFLAAASAFSLLASAQQEPKEGDQIIRVVDDSTPVDSAHGKHLKGRAARRMHRRILAQPGTPDKPSIKLYGFVRNYFTFDTRTCQTVNGGLFHTLPYDEKLNELDEDLNAQPSSQWMAFTTRLGLNLNGPKLGGVCDLNGKIEMDFCGFGTNNYVIRIRQAYAALQWKHNGLLLGQTWHPMFHAEMMPACNALSSGSPFQPFNRSPQIRYDVRFGKDNRWRFSYDLLWQLQYTSAGPDGASAKYQTNSCIPEMYFGIDHKSKNFNFGLGADLTSLKPRTLTTAIAEVDGADKAVQVKCNDRFASISPMLFLQYKNDHHFKIMAKALLAQNTGHLNMPSGYGVKSFDEQTGEYEYTPLRSVTTWVNPVWGMKSKQTGNGIQLSLFGGYSKNLGSKDPMIEEYVKYSALQHTKQADGTFKTIDQYYRIAPTYTYTIKCFQVSAEYELTGVTYGAEAMEDVYNAQTNSTESRFIGKVADDAEKNTVVNNRVCLMVKYNF